MLLHTLSALTRLHELEFGTEKGTVRTDIERIRCEHEISQAILKRYNILVERYGKTALVPIENNICSGCNIKQPNTGPIEVSSQIYQCSHCGRLLYYPDDLYEDLKP
ncbi:MAG: hypothetical protein NT106_05490 [Candidatus Sumerlaeota bacterium]|nr:hypothetical protein [Candidatus Sumerlaeota bacterium]